METTGTGRQDIFKINKPEFFWYYNFKWYELSVSQKGVAKDWDIDFKKNMIRLYNKKMEWMFDFYDYYIQRQNRFTIYLC